MAGTKRIEGLRNIPLFSELPDESLARLADAMNECEIEKGHVLVHRGMPGTGLFVIEEGEVVVDLTSRQVELGPGEFVGELALLTDSAHTGRAIAKTHVKAVAIGRDELSDLLHSEPSMALAMLSTLARRLAAAP
jgi:CRP/FNR family transcriptional regulator, cyclic AMP receptor protein